VLCAASAICRRMRAPGRSRISAKRRLDCGRRPQEGRLCGDAFSTGGEENGPALRRVPEWRADDRARRNALRAASGRGALRRTHSQDTGEAHPRPSARGRGLSPPVGYYLSEGHCQGNDSVFFTFGRTETSYISDTVDLCERVFGLSPLLQKGSGECTCVVLHSKLAVGVLRALFGSGFDVKTLPQCVMEAPREHLEQLLVGVFRGDACAVHPTQLTLQLSNRELILQLFQVALKVGPSRSSSVRTWGDWRESNPTRLS